MALGSCEELAQPQERVLVQQLLALQPVNMNLLRPVYNHDPQLHRLLV
jgi:hypothetical protein